MTNMNQKKIIVLDFDHYTAKYYAPTEFIEEFSETAPTPRGVERIYQFDEDQMAIIDMRYDKVARKVDNEIEANEVLLDWAFMDIHNECDRPIFAYTSKEQAIDFIDEMIEDLVYDENFEASEKCKKMKKAL